HFETEDDELDIPQRTQVVSGTPEQQVHIADLESITEQGLAVFETMHPVKARRAHNRISLWAWGDLSCCLPRGATAATLVAVQGMELGPGDLLLFEETLHPKTGRPADADPTHRQVVRLTAAVGNVDELYGIQVVDVQWG